MHKPQAFTSIPAAPPARSTPSRWQRVGQKAPARRTNVRPPMSRSASASRPQAAVTDREAVADKAAATARAGAEARVTAAAKRALAPRVADPKARVTAPRARNPGGEERAAEP